MLEKCGIAMVSSTVKNLQAIFFEQVHQMLGNIMRTCEIENLDLNLDDPWLDIMAETAWAINSTVHTVLDNTRTISIWLKYDR